MTNQTYIISTKETPIVMPGTPIPLPSLEIGKSVNKFITAGKALGYINFEILPVTFVTATGGAVYYSVQVNYYNPAVEE